MSSRNRNRNGTGQTVGYEPEEQLHWDNIEASLRTLANIQKRQAEIKEQALELEKKINERAKGVYAHLSSCVWVKVDT